MIKATLLQTCRQPQSNYAGPGKANQHPPSCKKPSCGEGYGCFGRQQGKEKESNPVGKSCSSDVKEQEIKVSTRDNGLQEPCRTNGEMLPLQTADSGLVPGNEHPLMRDSPRPASGLLHSGLSNRSDPNQEWKVVKVKRVLISPAGEPRKANSSAGAPGRLRLSEPAGSPAGRTAACQSERASERPAKASPSPAAARGLCRSLAGGRASRAAGPVAAALSLPFPSLPPPPAAFDRRGQLLAVTGPPVRTPDPLAEPGRGEEPPPPPPPPPSAKQTRAAGRAPRHRARAAPGAAGRRGRLPEGGEARRARPPTRPAGERSGAGDILRSASLSEKELKEAKARSQRIAAQLTTPPNSNSKGVLLFHRRKQRVNAFTLENTKTSKEEAAPEVCPKAIPSHGKEVHLKEILRDNRELKGFPCIKDSGSWSQKGSMEKHEESPDVEQTAVPGPQRNKIKNETLSAGNTTSSSEEIPAEDFQQIPLSVYLKENTATASMNGVHEPVTSELEKKPVVEQTPASDSMKNTPPIVDEELYLSGAEREDNSTTPEKEPYTPHTDRENNVLEKEPYIPLIDSENNYNSPDKELYGSLTDRENNVLLDKASSEAVIDPKENGEILKNEQDTAVVENEDNPLTADTEKPVLITDRQPNDTPTHNNKQYCEVRLTLSKPAPVKNRTARPFGTQSLVTPQAPAEKSPVVELPPPPTYAETFSSPPPVTRVRSPPAYSALYPSEEQKASVPQIVKYEDSRPGPPSEGERAPPPTKSGLLEESITHRAAKKSMFTFVEKPKVAPNPDLLTLVQRADLRKKQHGRTAPEDEPFALGAEASNFLAENTRMDGSAQLTADNAPEWSSCLRSPRIQPKPKIKSNQNLTEARGKGAELFARRQTRMQKYIIESSSHPDVARSPSPTISLPPSWKYTSETHLSPMAFQPLPKSPVRSPRAPPPVPLYNSNMTESEISKKELEISKQQPYQLQSSLFILSPTKDPVRSLPRGAPPPKPVVPEPSYMRQTSCPTSPLPSSTVLYPPVQSSPSRPGHFAPSARTVLAPQNITTAGAPLDTSVEYSSRIVSPRVKGVYQTPRPSYSTKDAGIEPQERRVSLPASPTWSPQRARQPSSLDGWVSPAQTPDPEEGHMEAFRAADIMTPPPMSPSWSERSLSPFRQEADPKSSRQMQVMLARNIINAARRKSSSPKATGIDSFRPFTPPASSANVSYSGGSPKNTSTHPSSPVQSPKPTRMDGYRRISLPVTTAAPSSNSSRLMGSHSPIYKSPLQSPKAVRMNGNKYFTLPASSGASLFNAASSNGPRAMGNHAMSYRDLAPSPKPSVMDTHRIFTPPVSTTRKSSCTSPKNLDTCSPAIKSPLQAPMMGTHYPVKHYPTSSPTNSDLSIDSEDSGIKSSSIHSFNICPRGWNGSLRVKRGSLPADVPCASSIWENRS